MPVVPGADVDTHPSAEISAERVSDAIRHSRARMHDLQNVDLDIPRDQLVVITGPSGSGKSSLAFDTLYAEGQRQYIESLSVYARQFLHQMPAAQRRLNRGPATDHLHRPAAGYGESAQHRGDGRPIYDYLRLLMARLGDASCPQCGEPIRQQIRRANRGDLTAHCPRHTG